MSILRPYVMQKGLYLEAEKGKISTNLESSFSLLFFIIFFVFLQSF